MGMETTGGMNGSLERLISICGNLGMPFVPLLRPGLSQETIRELTRGIALTLPPELIEFYEYCDGVDSKGTPRQTGVYRGYRFLPLQEAIEQYQGIQQERIIEGWEDISEAWFPLLRIDSAFYLIDCDKAREGKPFIVVYDYETSAETMYQSIQSMVDTFTDCYGEGAFTVEEGKVVSSDDQLVFQIAHRHNPAVKYWQDATQRQQELEDFLKTL